MGSSKARERLKFVAILLWLLFTVIFAVWWFTFSLDHIDTLAKLQPDQLAHWSRQRRMVFWEGTSWLVLLALGGGALIALVRQETLRVKRIREFFASFSHEVKTSLSSLRLQAETLLDEQGAQSSPILNRLVADTVRLQVQLENSLFLASQDSLKLYIQSLSLSAILERMREQWPDSEITLNRDCRVQADDRALRSVLSNLVQNARVHGGARKVDVVVANADNGQIKISFEDDGRGFDGDVENLGELFHRPKSTSGSGLGLHICRLLMERMHGEIVVQKGPRGLRVALTLPGVLA